MNNSIYEDYMRNVLGYEPMNYGNTYGMEYDNFNYAMPNMSAMNNIQMEELENCYPDIYRLVYPMVQKACMQNSGRITRETIDNMTDEIYFAIEESEEQDNRSTVQSTSKNTEVKQENRQRVVRNRSLNDLIRILILRELIGRPGYQRPGFPGGRPPRPPMRPFRPRYGMELFE